MVMKTVRVRTQHIHKRKSFPNGKLEPTHVWPHRYGCCVITKNLKQVKWTFTLQFSNDKSVETALKVYEILLRGVTAA